VAKGRAVQLAYSNPRPGMEEEFNHWYDTEHLGEVLANPGYVSGQRFKLSEYQRPHLPPARHSYLCIYELEGDLPELFAARDEAAKGSEQARPHHKTVNPDFFGYTGYLWVPMGPLVPSR
jgi:hypothetical protein